MYPDIVTWQSAVDALILPTAAALIAHGIVSGPEVKLKPSADTSNLPSQSIVDAGDSIVINASASPCPDTLVTTYVCEASAALVAVAPELVPAAVAEKTPDGLP